MTWLKRTAQHWKGIRYRFTKPSRIHTFQMIGIAPEREEYISRQFGNTSRYPTAGYKAIVRFGKQFIDTFDAKQFTINGKHFGVGIGKTKYESKVCVGVYATTSPIDALAQPHLGEPIGQAKIGFERESIIVESVQGGKGQVRMLARLAAAAQEPWPNALLKLVEQHAKECGFRYVKIRHPETLYYFWNPASDEPIKTVQQRMKMFYQKVAESNGYHENGNFYVKKLD